MNGFTQIHQLDCHRVGPPMNPLATLSRVAVEREKARAGRAKGEKTAVGSIGHCQGIVLKSDQMFT